jgi:hypothetical protein
MRRGRLNHRLTVSVNVLFPLTLLVELELNDKSTDRLVAKRDWCFRRKLEITLQVQWNLLTGSIPSGVYQLKCIWGMSWMPLFGPW